jgi:YVTN family beta-propeller protein
MKTICSSTVTKSSWDKISLSHGFWRLRLATACILFGGAAGLAAICLHPPRLPWAVPTVAIADNSYNAVTGVAVDPATNTIYVASLVLGDQIQDNTIAVIDGRRCSAMNASHCTRLAQLTNVGPAPFWLTFDPATRTLYVTNALTPDYNENNTITVLDTRTCNAGNTSGCNQMPVATVTVPGPLYNNDTNIFSAMALDAITHTLYVGDAHDGLVSMINTATCNAMNTSGCSQTPTTMANGDAITLDPPTLSVYATDIDGHLISVFSNTNCNSTDQSGCAQFTSFAVPYSPGISAVDSATHTLYVPMSSGEGTLGFAALVDVSACNGTVRSGCGVGSPHLVNVGSLPIQVLIDSTTRTAYIESQDSSSISVLNTATCNAQNQSGCPRVAPALATGITPTINMVMNSQTHTLYSQSQDSNSLWVFDTRKCNAMHTSGCTEFAPTTIVGAAPVDVAENPVTRTLYGTNQLDNTVSVIDTTVCNQHHLTGCNQTWPTVPLGNAPRFLGVNTITNSIYVSNRDDGTLSVINGATCNRSNTSSCSQAQPTTAVGTMPQQIAVDESTNTVYVVNQDDGTVSVINGSHCDGTDVSGCNQAWPTIAVGASPQGLGFNPNHHTLYVTNTNDNTVSVINTTSQSVVATFPAGTAPRAVGIVFDRNTVYIGNRDDLTVSIIDGATCNGTNTSGCPQSPPPAVLVGAFPESAGNSGTNILGRSIAVDQHKHIVYIPVPGDNDVAELNGNACRAGHVNDCHVKIADKRMGGLPLMATLDPWTDTVYVVNDTDGTVSLFPQHFHHDDSSF